MIIEGGPKGMMKHFRRFVKEELVKLVNDWHQETMPLHFEKIAFRKYRYLPRSIKYQRYKDRYRPWAGPLVYSGRSKRDLMRRIRVTASSVKATGSFVAPRYFWIGKRRKIAVDVDKAVELTKVTKKETLEMAQTLNERVTKKLNAIKDKEVIR